MKKISVYTRSGVTSPSSYYRILQYVEHMPCKIRYRMIVPDKIYSNYNKSKGIKRKVYQVLFYLSAYIRVNYYLICDIVSKPDTIFVSRAIMPRVIFPPIAQIMKKAFKKCSNLVWDIDDNIFGSNEITNIEKTLLLKYTKKIIVIGDYLKSLIPEEHQFKITYLSTTDGDYANENIEILNTQRKQRYDSGEVALLWLATYTSIPFVEDVIPYIDMAAKEIYNQLGKRLVLEIVCNRPLEVSTQYLQIVNYTWSKELASIKVKRAHIGIMPLRYNEQTLGKGGFKLVQYMSAGLATIGSAVGYSNEIIKDYETGRLVSYSDLTEWTKSIIDIASSWETLSKMGMKARRIWEKDFSYDVNWKKLKRILCEAEENEEK